MTKNKMLDRFKKILISIVLCLGFFVSCFSGLVFDFSTLNSVQAYTNTEPSITNGTFVTTGADNDDNIPSLTSGWSKVTTGVSSEDDIISGVYNSRSYLDHTEDYLGDFGLYETPGIVDGDSTLASTNAKYKSLMINSPSKSGHSAYEYSSTLTLEKASYYEFDVVLKTITADYNENIIHFDSRASIYIVDSSDTSTIIAKKEMVDSSTSVDQNNGWATYKLFIATSEFEAQSIKIQLWLGSRTQVSQGAVFFNEVKAYRYSEDTYTTKVNNANSTNSSSEDLRLTSEADAITNPTFNDSINGWSIKTSNSTSENVQVYQVVNVNNNADIKLETNNALTNADIPGPNNSASSGTNALLMYNPSENNYLTLESNTISISQHGYYRLTMWAWCNSGSSVSPHIMLVDKSDKNIATSSLDISTSKSSDNYTNGWVKYSFYIYGNCLGDTQVAIQLQLGSSDTPTDGYVFFDDAQLTKINYEDYTSGSTLDHSTTFVFSSDVTNYTIENDTFNITNNADRTITYPLAPASWTANVDSTTSVSGVINTATSKFNANLPNYTVNGMYPLNPGVIEGMEENNNVLMVGNLSGESNQYYTFNGSSSALSSSSYYKLSLYVATSSLISETKGATIKVYSGSETLFEIINIRGGWTKYTVYIATGISSKDLNIDLGCNAQGYAFFDDVHLETSSTEVFSAVTTSSTIYKVDLSSESFENVSQNTGTNTFDVNNWTATNNSETTVNAFVADLTSYDFESDFSSTAKSGKNALVISSDDYSYYSLKSNTAYTLSSGKYYKLSVWVRTFNLGHDTTTQTDSNVYGASISLINSDGTAYKTFYGINTLSGNTNNWTEYIFYVQVSSDTSAYVELALGSDKGAVNGYALFDNITLVDDEITDADGWNALDTTDDYIAVLDLTETSDDSTDTSDDNSFDGSVLWYLIPSLVTALAIIVALVGSLIRKINWKKKVKVSTTYDRTTTLEVDMTLREKVELRQNKINEYDKQLSDLDKELDNFEATSKQEETKFKTNLETENADLISKIKTNKSNIAKLEENRNNILATAKQEYTDAQEKEFKKQLKTLQNEQIKLQKVLSKKESGIVEIQEDRKNKLAELKTTKAFVKSEIQRLKSEITQLGSKDKQFWEEYKNSKKGKKLNKQTVEKEEIEISTPDETSESSVESTDSPKENTEDNTNATPEVDENVVNNDVDTNNTDSNK